MLSSPFMVAYGNLVIVLQYIYSFENISGVSGFFLKKNNPFHSLSSKVCKVKLKPQNCPDFDVAINFCLLEIHTIIKTGL